MAKIHYGGDWAVMLGPCFAETPFNKNMLPGILLLAGVALLPAAELHVATTGDDLNPGTKEAPLRTIQRAANLAQAGDTVTVHQGLYRERVDPPRGGDAEAKRIVYQAAPGEKVEIRGSEVVGGWGKVTNDTWTVTLPNSFFGAFNPFADELRGEWFSAKKRKHHSGAVYRNGAWLDEAANKDEVLAPAAKQALWFAEAGDKQTTLWAQFPGGDPNRELTEVNVRQAVFYPSTPGRNYITVRGFTMRHAATPWAGAQSEQIGLIGTHWSKGWIIEGCTISHSRCTGITLGLRDMGPKPPATAPGYVETIRRALGEHGWSKENIGGHLVRDNHISHCEKNAIHGSLGGIFSTIEGNVIHDIHVRRLFTGADMAGIKLLGSLDTIIRRNHVYRCNQALWLDWMAQGTRVTANLFHDNHERDLFMEVNHGPFLVDNNLLLSRVSLWDWSQGGAYVHNLFGGTLSSRPEMSRETPYHPAHSTAIAGLARIPGGDNRFYHNLFVGTGSEPAGDSTAARRSGHGLWIYEKCEFPQTTGGNVYYHGASPCAQESGPLVLADHDPALRLDCTDTGTYLRFTPGDRPPQLAVPVVTSERLGRSRVSGQPFVNSDGSPLKVDTDYFSKPRDPRKPAAGPFEDPGEGEIKLTGADGRLL